MAQSQPLSPNEIRDRALRFAREWERERREKAEAQTFWNEFFNVFGISRRRVASFEEPVSRARARLQGDLPGRKVSPLPEGEGNTPSPLALSQGERGLRLRAAVETAAQGVLDARAQFPEASLADLYDPVSMPPALVKAHQTLDRAVDAAYGKKGFGSDAERVAFLFDLYQKYTTLLPAAEKPKRGRRREVR